jgi:putative oxygen-independent coproporphyrinogen III oxidase
MRRDGFRGHNGFCLKHATLKYMFHFPAPPPLSLYIHIPWCVRKCPYCDFNSHEVRDAVPEQDYVEALIADLERDLPLVWGRTVETVFIGGGTPSLFSPRAIDRLLAAVRARMTLKPGAEITLEANPGTVDQERFREFREAGVNRLSLGIQSFQPTLLRAIGRIHDDHAAFAAVHAAREAGFDNLNLDLMFALPGQDIDAALADLRSAIALEPSHLSWYELTLEPNTWFHRHPPARPNEDTRWDMQQAGSALLGDSGYDRYEVSAYARPGRQCRHNLNYWRFGDYLGIGAGAHAKITDAARGTVTRYAKTRHPRAYLETALRRERIDLAMPLEMPDVLLEFAMNALRLDAGFTVDDFEAATGLPLSAAAGPLEAALTRGLIERESDVIRASVTGRRYLDDLLQYWMTEEPGDARSGRT